MKDNSIALEILKGSLIEHEKFEKDLHYVVNLEHPKLQKITTERNKIIHQIQQIKQHE